MNMVCNIAEILRTKPCEMLLAPPKIHVGLFNINKHSGSYVLFEPVAN